MPSQFAGRPSGVARTAFQLLEALIGATNYSYLLRSPWTREQLPKPLRDKALEVVTVPRPSVLVLDVIRQSLIFPAYCRREGIDLVVNLDPYGAAFGGHGRLMIVHDVYFRAIPEQIGKRVALTNDLIFRLMLLGNSEIVTVSDSTKRDLGYWYPQTNGRTTTIHSATSLQPSAHPIPTPDIAGRYVLAVGNATKNKNFETLAQAMAMIHSSCPDVVLVHVGDDPNEVIASTLQSLGSTQRLVRLSGIDDGQLAGLYRRASCLCVPSFYEGFCLPVLEAQVCGCPVICADRSAVPEIAGCGGLLFDPSDPSALADCLRNVLSSAATSELLVRKGYENAARFSWHIAARQYEKLFERMLAPASPDRRS